MNISCPNDYLHYDLSFLEPGKKWRPKEDKNRLEKYCFAREKFELTPEDMLCRLFPEKDLLWFGQYDSYNHASRMLGYPRLLTLKTVDMMIGQPPIITVKADDEKSEKLKKLRAASTFNVMLKQALIDYSRFGVFILRLFKEEKVKAKTKAQITVWNPMDWYPVFYADGTHRIKYNILGWIFSELLTVQIHSTEDGSYEERVYKVDSTGTILSQESSKVYNKESGKCLLYVVVNTPTSTNPMGCSDYEIIDVLLEKAIKRLHNILKVLDEHADPSMAGPHSLLSKASEESTELVFRTNKYYAVADEEHEPKYITWDGKLDSSFKAFEELCKQIYILSEMGEAFLGTSSGGGNVVSGTAMRFKMISPLEKARRTQNEITEVLKEIFATIAHLDGIEVDPLDLNIDWKDSLPKDPREVAELARLEAGAPAVKPLIHAIMDNYGLDKKSAEHYIEEIMKDLERFNPQEEIDDSINSKDGRSHGPEGTIDTRKQGSPMNPASSENRGEDSKK